MRVTPADRGYPGKHRDRPLPQERAQMEDQKAFERLSHPGERRVFL